MKIDCAIVSWPGTRSASHRCSTGLLLQGLLSLSLFDGPFFLFLADLARILQRHALPTRPRGPALGFGGIFGSGVLGDWVA